MKSKTQTQKLRILQFNPGGHNCHQQCLNDQQNISLKIVEDPSVLSYTLKDFQPHLLIYCSGADMEKTYSTLNWASHQMPQMLFAVVYGQICEADIKGLLDAGAYDLIQQGEKMQFLTLLQKCHRKLAQKELQENEGSSSHDPAHLASVPQPYPTANNLMITGSLAEIIWTANAKGQLDYLSESAAAFFGKHFRLLFKDNWMNFVHPKDLSRVKKSWENAQEKLTYYSEEFRIADKNRNYKWMRLTATPQFDDAGIIKGWAGLAVNIHRGKMAQRKLEKTTREIKEILESITESFISVNRKWEVQAWNQATEVLFNSSYENALGKKLWNLISADDMPQLHAAMVECRHSKQVVENTAFFPSLQKFLAFTIYPKEDGLSIFIGDITEKKAQEESLSKERERLQRAQETASIGDYEYDLSTNRGTWSAEAYKLFELPANKPALGLQETIMTYFPHEREKIVSAIEEATATRKNLSINASIQKADGLNRHVQIIGRVVYKNEYPQKLVGTIQDITLQHSYEMALQRSEDQLNRIANNIHGVVTQHWHKPDGNKELTYCSKGVERVYGYRVEEVLSQSSILLEAIHPEDAAILMALYEEKSPNLSPIDFEFRITNKQQEKRWLHMISIPTEHEKGGIIWDSTTWDITTSKQAQLDLIETKQLYQNLFDTSPLPIVIYNPDTLDILEVNSKAVSLYGYPKEEFLKLSLDKLRPEDKSDTIKVARKSVQKDDLERKSIHITKGGALLDVDLHGINVDFKGEKARQVYIKDITEMMQAQEELDYQKFALDQHALVSVTDSRGKIIYANENFSKTSGFSLAQLLGEGHDILKSEYHGKAFFTVMYKTITQGRVWKGEVKNKRPDGSSYWIDMTIVPYINKGEEKPSRYVAISTDISERKWAEAELKRESDRLEAAINGTGAGLFDWNIKSGEIIINSNYAEALGYSKSELTPANLQGIMHMINPDDHLNIKKAISEHFLGIKEYYECEFRARHKEGHELWLSARGKITHRDENNLPSRIIGTQINITDRKLKQQELDRMRINQNALINNLDDTIWSVDRHLNYLSFNQAFARSMQRSTGLKPHEGHSLLSLLKPSEQDMWLRYYKKVLDGQSISFSHTYKEHDTHFYFVLNPIQNEMNEVTGIACYGKNITETTNYLNSIKEQNEELRNISIMQSHEVRAPLARVMGLVQLVEQNIDRDESLEMMGRACKELDQVIAKVVKRANAVEQRIEDRHLRTEIEKATKQKN